MTNVPPAELPRVAWLASVPLASERIRALSTIEVPAMPAIGVASVRKLAGPVVGPRALPVVVGPGEVKPRVATLFPAPVQGPAQPVPPFLPTIVLLAG